MRGPQTDSRAAGRWAWPVLLCLLALTFPATADAYLYWGSFDTNSIARANVDGSHQTQQFVPDAGAPAGLWVTRSYVYWANYGAGTIGRANIDGTHSRPEFIVGAQRPDGVTVYGNYIYWANFGLNSIGRANLDGTHVNQRFITGSSAVGGVAVSPPYVYWTNFSAGTIGRANLDGSRPDQGFITGAHSPDGMVVNGNRIYWSNYTIGTIGQANLDGSQLNQSFITGASNPDDLTIRSPYIYWANTLANSIGRANLDGSGVNQVFLHTPASSVNSVAVDAGPPPPPAKSRIALMGRMGFVSPGGHIGVQVGCFNGTASCAGHIEMSHNGAVVGQTDFVIAPESGGFQNLKLTSEGSRLLNENRPFHLLQVQVIVTGTNGQRISQVMHLARWVWGNGSGGAHTTFAPLSPRPPRPGTSRIGLMGMMGFVSPGRVIGVQVGCFNGATTCAGQIKMSHNGVLVGQHSFVIAPESGGFQNLKLSSEGNQLLNKNRRGELLAVNVTVTGTNGQRISEVMHLARWVWH